MIARLLAARGEELTRAARIALKVGFGSVGVLVVGAGVAAVLPRSDFPNPIAELPAVPAPAQFAAFWITSLLAIVWAILWWPGLSLRSPGSAINRGFEDSAPATKGLRFGWAMSVMAAASMAYLYLFALPATEAYRGHREFAQSVWNHVHDGEHLALYRTREIVYYLRPPGEVREFTSELDLAEAVQQGKVRWAIVHERDVNRLGVPCTPIVREPAQSWDDDAAGTRAVLVGFRKQEGR